ncbi:P-loop NTPase fold protein [Pseudochelatococcus lubricantis]|uniref:KAP family P-loop NTPase fold protein n=1 Tax=Pseudochelatococcus lubricantis TaxID=1538102 RepID=UPI0035ECFCFB
MILTDNETKVDFLNNEAIAATIIKLLRDRPDQPVTVGIHGDWGAGKSSVLEMIEAGFDGEAKVLCLKFNGWRYQGFEDAKIVLIEGIVTGLIEKRPALTKAGGLAFTAFTATPTPDQIQAIVGTLEGVLAEGIAREAFIETIADLAGAGITDLDGLTADQMQTVSLGQRCGSGGKPKPSCPAEAGSMRG